MRMRACITPTPPPLLGVAVNSARRAQNQSCQGRIAEQLCIASGDAASPSQLALKPPHVVPGKGAGCGANRGAAAAPATVMFI